MANEGIFITKNGVTLPAVTEMSSSNFAAYEQDLVLALISDTDHEFNAFEGFKYRGYINENVNAQFIFNGLTNYTPSFPTGSGTLNTSTGEITPTTTPLSVEKANTVFMSGSSFRANQLADGDDVDLRIASIDGLSRILMKIDTKTLTFHKANVLTDTQVLVYTEPEDLVLAVDDDEITLSTTVPAELYSLPRTFVAAVLTGAVGVLTSSGTATGDALPFDQTDTLEAANIVANGTMSIASSFGQTTTYTVKLGASLITGTGFGGTNEVEFVAGQAGTHDVNDNIEGGVGTKSYALTSGQLPSGMVLTSGGVVQGVPVTDGNFAAFVTISDEYGTEVTIEYLFVVKQSANVSYNPPPAIEGVPYEYNPELVGITGAVVSSGTIPTGLSLNSTTGELTGTPSVSGSYPFSLTLTFDTIDEEVETSIVVYEEMTAEIFTNGDSAGLIETSGSAEVKQSDSVQIEVNEGSGQYQYSITGGNTINSQGEIELFETGSVTVTVVDVITGQVLTFTLLVAGQSDVCGLAIEEDEAESSSSAPCTDILTDCYTPVKIAFNGMQILKGVEPTEVPYREYPNFERLEGATAQNNGKAFSMFLSSITGGYGIADNAKDGKSFILEFAVDASVANSSFDMAIGIAREFPDGGDFSSLEYAVVITTVGLVRKVEIRKDNAYQAGSRFDIAEGQQVGFAVFSDSILLYVDGILKYQLSSTTFSCRGADIVFLAGAANLIVGGKAGNLIYAITTVGTADEVGTIDVQTGEYTPSLNNVGLVKIEATSSVNDDILYRASVRVIRGAAKASIEKAMIEGISVDLWVADIDRKDDLPLRLTRDGHPDKNQFTNPQHLGTLQGGGKLDNTVTRQDFRNDRGATSSSTVIDKVILSGVFLHVRDLALVKTLVPYMKEYNSHGVRRLKQFSNGCHKRMRVIMVWQTADCEDVPVFDAIELVNGLSYTMFNLEVGQAVQSNLPLSIEGFPDKDSVLFEYSQFDKHFHRIGA